MMLALTIEKWFSWACVHKNEYLGASKVLPLGYINIRLANLNVL